jgi:hypothetical protein
MRSHVTPQSRMHLSHMWHTTQCALDSLSSGLALHACCCPAGLSQLRLRVTMPAPHTHSPQHARTPHKDSGEDTGGFKGPPVNGCYLASSLLSAPGYLGNDSSDAITDM